MSDARQPENLTELAETLRSARRILPVGRMTKPAVSRSPADDVVAVSLAKLSGIVEYEPSEFTFTAQAGTPLTEIQQQLAERNQYLPFDPMLVQSGATLGGTVAAGISGPGRLRYGGLRDFILGVRLLCGDGRVVQAGGKVVKNAAGFDIPKLLVGSLGRLGIMTELTFKVFPKPPALQTYRMRCDSDAVAVDRITKAAAARWELDAIDYQPADRSLYLRIGGPEPAITTIAEEIGSVLNGELERLESDTADRFWNAIGELTWERPPEEEVLVKVPITPTEFLKLRARIGHQPLSMHLSVAGSLLWVALPMTLITKFSEQLSAMHLCGLVIRGANQTCWLGNDEHLRLAAKIKKAMDPAGRFPSFADSISS